MLRIKRPIFARRYLTTADFVHSLQVSAGHERRWKYVYDEFYDCEICPEYQPLKYRITNRDVYRELYGRRKATIERVFADAKEKHAMRYTQYRGLAQVTDWMNLKFAAMNLKKLAIWK